MADLDIKKQETDKKWNQVKDYTFVTPEEESAKKIEKDQACNDCKVLTNKEKKELQDEILLKKIESIIHDREINNQEKLGQITKLLEKQPYISSPLWEWKEWKIDKDNKFAIDSFDCTTFVETAIALLKSNKKESAQSILNKIRYKSNTKQTFENRNHFPGAEWIPDMEEKWFLEDITAEIWGSNTQIEEKVISHKILQNTNANKHLKNLPEDSIPNKKYWVEYVTLDDFLKNSKNIPSSCVLNIVRKNRDNRPTLITHQVLFIKDKENPNGIIREASSRKKEVIWLSIEQFVNNQRGKKWEILWFNINKIV